MNYQILTTTNYSLFKKLNGNRDVDPRHVSRIKISMQEQLLPTVLEVNENFEIIDGQHRLQALMKLNLPVHYFIHYGAGLSEAQKHNKIKKTWSGLDIVESHVAAENENYIFIKHLMRKYNLTLTNALVAVTWGFHGQDSQYKFQHGKLKIYKMQDVENLVSDAMQINAIKSIARKTMWTTCLKALQVPEFELTVFLQKLLYLKDEFKPQVTNDQQGEMLEKIYNYRNRKPLNIAFLIRHLKNPNQQ